MVCASVNQDAFRNPPSPLWEPEFWVYLKTQPEPGESPSALKLWPWLHQCLVQEHSWLLFAPFMNTQITAFLSGPLRWDALLLWLIMHQLINSLALVSWINYFKWLLIAHICIISKDKSGSWNSTRKPPRTGGSCKTNYLKFPKASSRLPKYQWYLKQDRILFNLPFRSNPKLIQTNKVGECIEKSLWLTAASKLL